MGGAVRSRGWVGGVRSIQVFLEFAVLCFICWVGSSPVFGSLELRQLPMLVKYLLNCSTISFLSVQLVSSEVINLSFTICFLFFDFNTSFIVFQVFPAILFI